MPDVLTLHRCDRATEASKQDDETNNGNDVSFKLDSRPISFPFVFHCF